MSKLICIYIIVKQWEMIKKCFLQKYIFLMKKQMSTIDIYKFFKNER